MNPSSINLEIIDILGTSDEYRHNYSGNNRCLKWIFYFANSFDD